MAAIKNYLVGKLESRLRHNGQPVKKGATITTPKGQAVVILGFNPPSKQYPNGRVLHYLVGQPHSKGITRASSLGLTWAAPAKPTRSEQLVPTWAGVILVYAQAYPNGAAQEELMRCARLADLATAFAKRWPLLWGQLTANPSQQAPE